MKLTYFQLEPHLAKKLASIYVISGDELILKQDATRMLRKAAKQAGFTQHTRLTIDAGVDAQAFYNHLYSPSLFAEKQLLELAITASINKTIGPILIDYAKNPSPTLLLLIETAKLDSKISKSAWYQTLEKQSIIVSLWPVKREQLPQWIQQYAKKYRLQLTPDAAQLLTDYTEGNLIATAQAIEKIYLLKPENPIDITWIEKVINPDTQFTIFDFVDSILAKNLSRSAQILAALQADDVEPTLILWSITRELRLLHEMLIQHQQGMTLDVLLQKYRIFSHKQMIIKNCLKRFTLQNCEQYLLHALKLDEIIKGASPGNIWQHFELFYLRLS